ncbi:flavin reductase family protein [Paraconexibacter sp.]|uniref:flavin reductase family protein n=1 Tax=Paraconexibacter sp. TaxID=2949640 RepID=UPI00356588D6
MPTDPDPPIVSLSTAAPIWDRFFRVAPLVIVGTREADGREDLAPKHMAMPLGWQNYFGFVCSPRHATQGNAQRTGEFTVSFPRAEQFLQISMAAGGRRPDDLKPSLAALRTRAAEKVDGVLVEGAAAWLECDLDRVVDGFGDNTLLVGRVVAAAVAEPWLRDAELDDGDLIHDAPVLAYLDPGRFASVEQSLSFPFPADFRR